MSEPTKEINVSGPGMIIASLIETLLPVGLSYFWIKCFNGKFFCILIGIAGFVASVVIESLILFILSKITGNDSVFYYIISVISPGIFEETGRYFCFKYLLSKEENKNRTTSVSYGIGHGGIESMFIGFSLLIQFFMINKLIEQGIIKEDITFFSFFAGVFERISAITFHISASVLVYKAVLESIIKYYIIAIVMHDVIDFFAFLYHLSILKSIIVVEIIVAIFSLLMAYYAYQIYKNLDNLDSSVKKPNQQFIQLRENEENKENN